MPEHHLGAVLDRDAAESVLCEELSRRDDDPGTAIELYQRARRRKAAASWPSARSLTEDARYPWLKVKIPDVILGTAFSLVLRAVSNCLRWRPRIRRGRWPRHGGRR